MDNFDASPSESPLTVRDVLIEPPRGGVPGYFAAPSSDAWKSAVVVIGDHLTLDDHARETCRRLAREGHAAIALDLTGGADSGVSLVSRRPGVSDRDGQARAIEGVAAGLELLRTEASAPPARFGVVGYGGGGLVALVAGYRCQVGAAISFYGEGPMQLRANLSEIIERPKRHAASFLCLVGGEDDAVRPEDLGAIHERLDTFGMRHTFIVYPRTRSGFCQVDGPRYRAAEANDAWGKVLHALETAPRLRHRFQPKARLCQPPAAGRVRANAGDAR